VSAAAAKAQRTPHWRSKAAKEGNYALLVGQNAPGINRCLNKVIFFYKQSQKQAVSDHVMSQCISFALNACRHCPFNSWIQISTISLIGSGRDTRSNRGFLLGHNLVLTWTP
jgi:hypothetical protein